MPVSEISGVAATLGPPPPLPSMGGFAEQLMRARAAQRDAAMQTLEAATKIAEHDPVLAEEIGGKAVKELTKHTGKSNTEMYFQNIFEGKQKERQQADKMAGLTADKIKAETERTRAQIPQIDAETKETLAKAGYEASEAGFTKLKADMEARTQQDEKDLENPDLDPTERATKAVRVATHRGLPVETADLLAMDPKHRKMYLDSKATKANQDSVLAELKTASYVSDFRDKKGNAMTPDQANAFIKTGALPPGFDSPERQKIVIEARQAAASEKRAQTAEDAEKANALERTARAYKELIEADFKAKHGEKTSYDDLIKTFNDSKLDPKIREKAQKEIADRFGLQQQESKSLWGMLWGKKEFGEKDTTPPPSSKALEGEDPAKGTDAYEMGKSVRPAIEGAVTKGVMGTVQGVSEAGTAIENFIRGMSGSERAAPGQTSPDLEKYYAEQRKRRDERSGR